MIDPRVLAPEVLGVQWGWSPAQCATQFDTSFPESGSCTIEIEILSREETCPISLLFWALSEQDTPSLQSVQYVFSLPNEIDLYKYLESLPDGKPRNRESAGIIETEIERRRADLRDYHRQAGIYYSHLLGRPNFNADDTTLGWPSLQTKAAIGWRFENADVQLAIEAENCSEWEFEELVLTLLNLTNGAFFFHTWQPRSRSTLATSPSFPRRSNPSAFYGPKPA